MDADADLVGLVTSRMTAWAAQQAGRVADADALRRLNARLGGMIPGWYALLISELPLGGLRLEVPQPDGAPVAFEWATVSVMDFELLQAYPGLAIWPHGYVVIGTDPTGGGDPFVVHGPSGPASPVYQVPHDGIDEEAPDPAQFWLIAPSFLAFVATAEPA
ncbi:MAG TPA: hypothetical protein VGE07_30865 [Herpetosiphonaceae bacterium]